MSGVAFDRRPSLRNAILAGGFVAGSFDLIAAFVLYGWGVPRGIAGGLLGRSAFQGGTAIWILGVLLHYTVAYGAATIYCLTSLKLKFLKEHYIVCGMFFGIAIYLVMNLIVLPLSQLHSMGPFKLYGMIQGLLVHMFLIGVPIAFCLRRFSK